MSRPIRISSILLLSALLLSLTPRPIPRPTLLSSFIHSPSPRNLPRQPQLLVAAAADLRFAMDSLLVLFQKDFPGASVRITYGASGNFYEQITNGAPFDLFLSADMDYPTRLANNGKTLTTPRQYATGHIVLWSKKTDPSVSGIKTLLSDQISRIAIANPAHAPYGKRAEQCLQYYKLYDQVKSKLVTGENISQATEFVRSGAADAGIIALSLALSPAMRKEGGKFWIIPQESYEPLRQGYVLLQHAKGNELATSLTSFIASAKSAPVWQYFGLTSQ